MLFYLTSLESTEEFVWTSGGKLVCCFCIRWFILHNATQYFTVFVHSGALQKSTWRRLILRFDLLWRHRDRVSSCTALCYTILDFILCEARLYGPLLLFLNVIYHTTLYYTWVFYTIELVYRAMNEPLHLHLLAKALDLTAQGAVYYTTLYYTVLYAVL